MENWKGLFKKEWMFMKWGIIALALLTVFIVLLGPVKFTNAKFYNEYTSHLFTGVVPEGFSFLIGILLVGGLLTVILFVAGSMLFEKKVRL